MSKYFSSKYSALTPYTPGEQPGDMKYIKLNTNESPFPPSEKAMKIASEEIGRLMLYSDPTCNSLVEKASEVFGLDRNEIIFSNGSDEVLNFAFMAFCDNEHPAVFPNITYGFYPVFAQLNGIPYEEIPLNEDFSINVNDYIGINKTIFIANPNALTGIALGLADIEKIVKSNPENVIVIDEAYVDFGTESAIKLIPKYDNLLVVQTFSKSRSLAGARLGVAFGQANLINDLSTVKYSTNPYNVNRMTMAAGVGSLGDEQYTKANCREIIRLREYTVNELKKLGFTATDSSANFILVKSDKIGGEKLYLKLKEKGVLVRHFNDPLIREYNRVTIGNEEQMRIFINKTKEVLEENV